MNNDESENQEGESDGEAESSSYTEDLNGSETLHTRNKLKTE